MGGIIMEKQTPILDKDFEEELEAKNGFWAHFEYLCAFKEMMRKKNQENGQEN